MVMAGDCSKRAKEASWAALVPMVSCLTRTSAWADTFFSLSRFSRGDEGGQKQLVRRELGNEPLNEWLFFFGQAPIQQAILLEQVLSRCSAGMIYNNMD